MTFILYFFSSNHPLQHRSSFALSPRGTLFTPLVQANLCSSCQMRFWCFSPCWRVTKLQHLFRGWKVASFILGIVFSQSFAHIVAIANLMPYLMDVLEEKLPKAAATANIRMSITAIMSIFGSFVSEVYTGRYQMVLYSTIIYITGLLVLAVAASSPHPGTTGTSTRISMIRIALVLIAFGKAGHTPMLKAFGDDQFRTSREENDVSKVKTQANFWWCVGMNWGAFAGIGLLAIVDGKQSWGLGYGVLTMTMTVALCLFVSGKPFYNYVEPQGSVLTRVIRVLIAALLNKNLEFPQDASQSYREGSNNLLRHTDGLRFLDKAAIVEHGSDDHEEQEKKWSHCTVTEVEETKLLLRMLPMWATFLLYGLVKSLGSTFFLQQGSNMNRKLRHANVPLPMLLIFTRYVSGQITWLNKWLLKKFPQLKEVINPIRRIGIGMLFCIFCCSTASSVEAKRLDVVKRNGLEDHPKETLPISVFWLTPQFLLLGAMDGFTYPGIKDFFYDQVPKRMENFGPSFTASVIGVGSLLGVIVIAASDRASRQGGQLGWFADTINRSHLDYFYQTLTVLSYINLILYGFVASRYTYKKADLEDEPDEDIADTMSF